ncbi:hypothetical protein [Arthrobacter woluwensis]|uniref:hypothetical protein n=1 Tax=Arthrobacter woluwensis TaxID=156980 RepID=UPI0037F14DCD
MARRNSGVPSPAPEGMIGAAAFAELLGVKPATLYSLRSRDPRFPEGTTVGMMSFWSQEEAEEFAAYRRTLRRGRPKGSKNKPKASEAGDELA